MARDRHLPHALAAVHPRFQVPHRAELAVGAVVAVLAATVDLRGAIGFSSFGVLAYYAIANAVRLDPHPAEGRPRRAVPVVGLAGCLALAFALPVSSVVSGAPLLAAVAAWYGLRTCACARRLPPAARPLTAHAGAGVPGRACGSAAGRAASARAFHRASLARTEVSGASWGEPPGRTPPRGRAAGAW